MKNTIFPKGFPEEDFLELESLAREAGWQVVFSNTDSRSVLTFTTPLDYDGEFEIEVESTDQVVRDVENAYLNFDLDEQTYIWLGPDGHGANGAPYHIRDVLRDMEIYNRRLGDLFFSLRNFMPF